MKRTIRKKCYMCLSTVILVALLGSAASHAGEKSNSQPPGNMLTQLELSQCNAKEDLLAQTANNLKARSEQLKSLKKDMDKLLQNRQQAYASIDFHKHASVHKYNLIDDQFEQLSHNYTKDVMNLNKDIKQYKADAKQLKSECDNKQYYKK